MLKHLARKYSSFLNDFEPHSVVRIIPGTGSKASKPTKPKVENVKAAKRNGAAEIGRNEVGIQMISENLCRQIFGECESPAVKPEMVERYRQELHSHGIKDLKTPKLPEIDIKLPKLRGRDVEEHFHNIASSQVAPYRRLIKSLLNAELPKPPDKWVLQSGWTRYDSETGLCTSVPYLEEEALVFDVEVCVSAGNFPVMATAVGPNHWYSWTSKKLINIPKNDTKSKRLSPDDLIAMESTSEDAGFDLCERLKTPRLVIGHNVSYDRARVKEQYWMENTGTRFLDTMSLHVCVSGVTSYQRAMMKAHKDLSEEDQNWGSLTSLNSLKEVHKLYCHKDEAMDKEMRNVFLEGSLRDIRNDFQNLMRYCANDVIATNEIIRELYPLFEERFPHPATLAGMLELGLAYLPINSNWLRYINEANLTYEDLDIESKTLLSQRADHACRLKHDDAYKNNLWMWDQDWSEQQLKLKKNVAKGDEKSTFQVSSSNKELQKLSDEFKPLVDKALLLPARRPLLPGYPLWYRNLCEKYNESGSWSPGALNVGTGMQIAPKLLSLCWEGFPLHFIRGEGWGFLMPTKRERPNAGSIPLEALLEKCPLQCDQIEANENESNEALSTLWKDVEQNISKKSYYSNKKGKKYTEASVEERYKGSGVWCNIELENCCWFFKLPHKDGKSKNVGNPLAKDFINKFSENVLTGEGHIAERVIEIARMLSYWRNNRDRIMGQMVVWLHSLPKHFASSEMEYGAIVPQVVVCGTLTRRAMERTWMTASNSKTERVGSELRGMVQAPDGYKIVGADVDSQELWIASLLGDSERKIHGSTPFGWMTLSGTKSNGTDLHTITANAVGISRDHAKVINYARIYGAGQNFAQTLLRQFNPSISDNEAKSKAIKMFTLTKGKKVYNPLPEYREDYSTSQKEGGYSAFEAMRVAALHGKSVHEVFSKPQWRGGSESAMFNKLEEIADSDYPVTPFLNCRLSRALEPQPGMEDRYLPTRINWVVQSGAVDFLHLILVSMRWLMGDKIRFCLSFHDEVRYIVKEEHANEAALALHITNLLVRSFCVSRFGFRSLPQSVAFFTSVEIDKILRKEAENDCKTPSNEHGFSGGYSIKPGESVDIYEAVKRVGNDISSWTK